MGKKNKNKSIEGFKNVYWNGVTCYQLAKIIYYMINNNIYWKGVRHIYSPNIVSKYELCSYINEIYNLNITIIENIHYKKKMNLSSKYNIFVNIPDIKEQIIEQKEYNIKI